MAPSDTVAQRQALGQAGELKVAQAKAHKLLYARSVKATKVTQAQVRKAAGLKVTDVDPATLKGASTLQEVKKAKASGKKRPKAKTA
jgi:hypothetical protein